MSLIRNLVVRGVTAAGAAGAAVAIALAPQPGIANSLSIDQHTTGVTIRTATPAPSAACVAAKAAFVAAVKADATEDESERALEKTGNNTNDPAEDAAEKANFQSLRSAVETACEPNEADEHQKSQTPPSDACVAAKAALKSAATAFHAEEESEEGNGSEGTADDRTEDQPQIDQLKSLFQAAATACGWKTFSGSRSGSDHQSSHSWGGSDRRR